MCLHYCLSGLLARSYFQGDVSPSQFALWDSQDIERSFNTATWYLGAKVSSNVTSGGKQYRVSAGSTILRNDTRGREVLLWQSDD